MTTPLWSLLGFVVWTACLVLAIGLYRVPKVLMGQARAGSFTGGVPHGPERYWRLNRAHLNCVENLPLFAAVVLTATVARISHPAIDTLAVVYLIARVGQSTAHISSGRDMVINVRFTFFLTQLTCLLAMIIFIAMEAS
jgi:uncharacterized MAPEG superfamily protein